MPTLHLMVGLPCSGKTTTAKILEKEYNALVLTTDKWHIKLFGNDALNKDHDRNHENVEELLWEIAVRVLALGIDVILDFGFWGRGERIYFKKKAKELNVNFKIHYMDVPVGELYKRLEKRNNESSEAAFLIPKEKMDEYIKMFQPVEQDELQEAIEDKITGRWHNYYA
ncbi:MAG: ATP-binding protein [Treponema sp.]|nr:ATP-binding protein [Treponema sp.]